MALSTEDSQEVRRIFGVIDQTALVRVQEILSKPENEIDFAQAKLAIDQIIDPSTNPLREAMRLSRMVDNVEAMGPFSSSSLKKDALRRYLFDAGDWNRHRPFRYDLTDPRGKKLENKLLANYMSSRRGNCISMPVLFLILGQKLGLDVTGSTAPLHMFVKFTETETGTTYNLETTSGGHPARDSS